MYKRAFSLKCDTILTLMLLFKNPRQIWPSSDEKREDNIPSTYNVPMSKLPHFILKITLRGWLSLFTYEGTEAQKVWIYWTSHSATELQNSDWIPVNLALKSVSSHCISYGRTYLGCLVVCDKWQINKSDPDH